MVGDAVFIDAHGASAEQDLAKIDSDKRKGGGNAAISHADAYKQWVFSVGDRGECGENGGAQHAGAAEDQDEMKDDVEADIEPV